MSKSNKDTEDELYMPTLEEFLAIQNHNQKAWKSYLEYLKSVGLLHVLPLRQASPKDD